MTHYEINQIEINILGQLGEYFVPLRLKTDIDLVPSLSIYRPGSQSIYYNQSKLLARVTIYDDQFQIRGIYPYRRDDVWVSIDDPKCFDKVVQIITKRGDYA